MAIGDLFQNVKQKVRSMYDNFFYESADAPAPQQGMGDGYAGEQAYQPQQPAYQQPQPSWQQPQANAYQQPQANAYSQPGAYQQQSAYQQPSWQQPQQPQRSRRAQQRAGQAQDSNVVDFGAYQQQNAAQQPAWQQPPQPQQPQPEAQPQGAQPGASLLTARVINARGMGDCRSAITLLRKGDAVLMVMEGITDPAEMRRLVDTLSGACYCLTATITKVSRYGVYLLAPQTMPVFTDQVTSQMNSGPVRPRYQPMPGQQQRPAYGAASAYQPSPYPPQQPYGENGGYPPQANAYQQPQQAYQPFSQRQPAPEEAPQAFYVRPAPQQAAAPAFAPQQAATGYAPDEAAAAE